MLKLKSLLRESEYEVDFISPNEVEFDYYDDLNRIEKESGIRIMSYSDLDTLAVKNGNVVGALYTGHRGNRFSFDIIVDKDERGKGIGHKLTNIGLSLYRDLPKGYELELDVVNSNMINFLEKKGLKIVNQIDGHTIMTF